MSEKSSQSPQKRPADERQQIAKLLAKLMPGRTDCVGLGRGVSMICDRTQVPITPEMIEARHLGQNECLGVYPLMDDGTVRFAVIDLDNKEHAPDHDIEDKVLGIGGQLSEASIPYLIERSQSGRGFHVWIFFSGPVDARLVRRFLVGMLKKRKVAAEVFPKQERLEAGKVGNCIRLPLWNRSEFVDDMDSLCTIPPLRALTQARGITADKLVEAAKEMEIDVQPRQTIDESQFARGVTGLPEHVERLLNDETSLLSARWRGNTDGLNDKSRSSLVFAITRELIKQFVPTAEIHEALRVWCDQQQYDKGEREDWIEHTVHKAYEYVADNYVASRRSQEFVHMIGRKKE
jgi:hypothetical protein